MTIENLVHRYLVSHGVRKSLLHKKMGWTNQKTDAVFNEKETLSTDELDQLCEVLNLPCGFFYNIAVQQTQNS